MPVKDIILICESCGNQFLYSREEQRQTQTRSGSLEERPSRCPGCRALDRLTRRPGGTVKWYSPRKGYGFIAREGKEDLFLHASGIAKDVKRLKGGQPVSFCVEESERGPRAVDVRPT